MSKSAGFSRTFAGFHPQGLADFLRAAHPTKTAQAVEAASGHPARTVERWLALSATPSAFAFARLVAAYGPGLLKAAIPGLGWVERAARLAEREGIAREIARLEARYAATGARLERDV